MGIRRILVLTTVIVACGIDESGLLPDDASLGDSGDSSITDSGPADVPADIPQGCKTLNTSACIDADIPDGWTLVALATTPVTCTPDYDQQQYVHDLQLEAGSCACGCTSTGSYSCGGSVAFGSNCGPCSGVGSCSNKGTFDAGDDAGCVPTGFTNSPDIAIGPLPTPTSGSAGCDASTGAVGYTSSALTACVPKCTADYCNIGSAFKRCIISTQPTCPAPFVNRDTMGSAGVVSATCDPCTCKTNPVGSCSASITYYGTTDCTTTAVGTSTAPTCKGTGQTSLGSFTYTPTDPTVSCAASAADGSVGFGSPITVCCMP